MKNIKLGDQVYEGVETVRLDTAEGGTVDYAPYEETFSAGRVEGYNAGKEAGLEEGFDNGKAAGIQAEYDRFWDAYQKNGNRISYNQAFSGMGWTDETFKPKYPLENVTYAMNMFFQGGMSKIDYISLDGPQANGSHWQRNNMFTTCQAHTITIEFKGDFLDAGMFNTGYLKNLTVLGTMGGTNVTFQQCPLTVESMKSVITHLKNYAGTAEAGTYKVTFSPTCWTALEADGTTAPDGNTWRDYVETTLGWLT